MDEFNICIFDSGEPGFLWEERSYSGEIVIGNHRELLHCPVEYWSPLDYRTQWKEALQRLLKGQDISCLITEMRNPKSALFIEWWPMFRIGDDVIFHNQILFLKKIRNKFDETDPYSLVEPREMHSEDGSPISEWKTTIPALLRFLNAKQP